MTIGLNIDHPNSCVIANYLRDFYEKSLIFNLHLSYARTVTGATKPHNSPYVAQLP